MRRGTISLAALLLAAAATAQSPPPDDARKAAAVLAVKCIACHNPTAKAGGFDLTRRSGAAAVIESGRLAKAVTEGRMPPEGRLPDEQRALLARWSRAGGVYASEPLAPPAPRTRALWSIQTVHKVHSPASPFDRLAVNPIDSFVFARLAQKGLAPSPLADRRTLLRRVTFDLTGLPPTPEEIAAFLADTRPGAYERVVDRLLASPAYGERAARLWLDVVRFGESNGYEQNHLRGNAWPYRDYVIRSFNADKPYARFVLEQLAADTVAPDDADAACATGFLVAGIHDTVGIQTDEGTRQQRSNDLDDIVATTSAAFLGLTVNCARCHDHKFDPIPQKDYYRLTAVFAGVRHGERALPQHPPSDSQARALADAEAQLRTVRNRIQELDADARARALAARGAPDGARPAVNARRNVDEFPAVTARFVRFTIEATKDGAEPCIDEIQVFGADPAIDLALASRGARATASDLLQGYPIHQIPHLNDGIPGNDHSWISNTRGGGWAQIELPEPAPISRVVWSRDSGDTPRFDDRLAARYRIEVSDDGKAWRTVATDSGRAGSSQYLHPNELDKVRTPEARAERARLDTERAQLVARCEALSGEKSAYIGRFESPEPVYLLRRGDVMQRGETVLPGAFSCIRGLPDDFGNLPEGRRRLALAHWIATPENPLTGRVLVNRLWQQHFGRGIVGTPSDFGFNGEPPTHPELLDWLASELWAGGGRLKRLHRLMVTSYVYRQGVAATPRGMALDAGNRLLWRMPLRRLEAEAVRDAILATSGKLDRRMGGPGFRLYGYNVVNIALYDPQERTGPETWRRGIYQQAARGVRDDLLGAFDCPESSVRTARRESTTTALQALALLNGAFVTEQAGFLAQRARGATVEAQVDAAFRLALGRVPTPRQRRDAVDLARTDGLPALCRALLNTNEFLYY